MRFSHLFLALLILESTAYGFNNNASYPTLTSLPNTQLLVHLEPNINLSVTNFGILGAQEKDSGHEVRRFGEEMLFQTLKEVNTDGILSTGVQHIITVAGKR